MAGACLAASVALWPRVAQAQAPLTVLDVPFVPQSEELCGGAAAAMVLRYWGERGVAAESFAHLVDQSAAGIRTSALVDDLRGRGWNVQGVEGTEALLARELAQGRPVVALIEDRPGTFHYVVVVAAAPTAVLFHDPARAPFRGMPRDEFGRRWAAADRWMAVVVPGTGPSTRAAAPLNATPSISTPTVSTPTAGGSADACQAVVADAAQAAGAGDVERAERVLTTSTACSASTTFRELAGLRALQRRWPEAGELAASAVEVDPADQAAWRLLATSRFVQNDRRGALAAWNKVDEPKLDTLQFEGLKRTRVPVATRAAGVEPGDVVTEGTLTHLERRLGAVPAFTAAAAEYVPAPGGLADVRASIVERSLWP
ncbi:MAG TPA: C39 family peptidase, partial [Vicinamibacterales bacterium]